jgi:hypothetical protein
MRTCMRRAALIAALGVLSICRPALALFHVSVIDEIMSGSGGVQFVEIKMKFAAQNFVTNARVTQFDCSGSMTHSFLVPTDLGNSGNGVRWIVGTTAFAAAAGISTDFTDDGLAIDPTCGQVCYGAPVGGNFKPVDPMTWDASDPTKYIDCVAYGAYTGTLGTHSGTPTTLTPGDGTHSLTRTTDTDDNLTDFVTACPSPINNAGSAGQIGSCVPSTTTSTSTSTTTIALPAGLSGGKPLKTDCYGEWIVIGATGTKSVVACKHGTTACDTGTTTGACTFRAAVCFDDAAASLFHGKCTASPVSSFALTGPSKDATDTANAQAAIDAVKALGGTAAGNIVGFSPALATKTCSGVFELQVPLKVKGGKSKPGKRLLKSTTTASNGSDRDKLKLVCRP